jgi:hypothetical protein
VFGIDTRAVESARAVPVEATVPEAVAVVVDVLDEVGHPTAAAVAALRRSRNDIPIVVWAERTNEVLSALPDLGRAGASALVF